MPKYVDTSLPHDDAFSAHAKTLNGEAPIAPVFIDPANLGQDPPAGDPPAGDPPANQGQGNDNAQAPAGSLPADFKMPDDATPAYKAFTEFAKANKVDLAGIDHKAFSAKDYEEKITDYYFQKRLEKLDPSVKSIIDGGLPPSQYFEQVQEIDTLLSYAADELIYVETFQKIHDSLEKIGVPALAKLYTGADADKLSEEDKADAYIDSLTKAELAKLKPDDKAKLDEKYRADLKSQREAMVKPQKPVYNLEAANKYASELSEKITAAKEILNVEVDGQAYTQYVKDLFTVSIENDKVSSKFQKLLETDTDAMRLITTILYLKDNNGLTDLKNFYENKALEKLGVGSFVRTGSEGSAGRKYVDTTKPH